MSSPLGGATGDRCGAGVFCAEGSKAPVPCDPGMFCASSSVSEGRSRRATETKCLFGCLLIVSFTALDVSAKDAAVHYTHSLVSPPVPRPVFLRRTWLCMCAELRTLTITKVRQPVNAVNAHVRNVYGIEPLQRIVPEVRFGAWITLAHKAMCLLWPGAIAITGRAGRTLCRWILLHARRQHRHTQRRRECIRRYWERLPCRQLLRRGYSCARRVSRR